MWSVWVVILGSVFGLMMANMFDISLYLIYNILDYLFKNGHIWVALVLSRSWVLLDLL